MFAPQTYLQSLQLHHQSGSTGEASSEEVIFGSSRKELHVTQMPDDTLCIVVMTGSKEIGQHLFKAVFLKQTVTLSFCLPEPESYQGWEDEAIHPEPACGVYLFIYLKDPHYLESMTPVNFPGVPPLAIYNIDDYALLKSLAH